MGQSRRDQYCIFIPGRPALTNAQAAREIIEEAKKIIQQDLQAMGFGMVVQKRSTDHQGTVSNHFTQLQTALSDNDEEEDSNSDTDDSDEKDNDHDLPSPSLSSSNIEFPSLLNDPNIHVRNAYVDRKHICSEFILMIEHKETMAISCFAKKITKSISGN